MASLPAAAAVNRAGDVVVVGDFKSTAFAMLCGPGESLPSAVASAQAVVETADGARVLAVPALLGLRASPAAWAAVLRGEFTVAHSVVTDGATSQAAASPPSWALQAGGQAAPAAPVQASALPLRFAARAAAAAAMEQKRQHEAHQARAAAVAQAASAAAGPSSGSAPYASPSAVGGLDARRRTAPRDTRQPQSLLNPGEKPHAGKARGIRFGRPT
uniref:Uncharacterized protein n=1 Tax=Neobodo designis TaxID=312471 RepID=A0A7S1Q432_NEODS|mmetsp:Transcript_30146/g.93019  ORF Transcript_30146/g.93019 Transcript_30146/m.93019 type:complete len:216 (+) Transcript_30146:47-694(+)|eukprot:CAMPEP_0174863360 /NCGR_PEP_ID=MMETSP1114-20130205/56069_1 /TAXON_ID=312471 /ORGANISM="Neobodo designis, Strain CCAP 1951/1" /LENGTH=215 /DNA_ID=CAMNT_0016098425 /DNA_START=46 /DNA_END=693 /DNA_ORIENTATION=+